MPKGDNKMCKQQQIIVVNHENFTFKVYSPSEFIEEFAEETLVKDEKVKAFQYNETTHEIVNIREKLVLFENATKIFAEEKLLEWALIDIRGKDDVYEAFVTKEKAIKALQDYIAGFEEVGSFDYSEGYKKILNGVNELQ